jgi:hypothetical protein
MTHPKTFVLLVALLATACTPYAATPAIRTVPLETVAPIRPDNVALSVSGGVASSEVYESAARVRVGLVEDLELQLEGSWAYAAPLERDRALSGHAGAGRVGVKHRVLEWLAFTGGLGSGSGPWGAFGGADVGAIFAYENPYVVPFFDARMQLTTPFGPETERLVTSNGDGTTMVRLLTPTTTMWLQASTGVRIPICGTCEGVRGSVIGGVSFTQLYALDQDRTSGGLGGTLGLELEL